MHGEGWTSFDFVGDVAEPACDAEKWYHGCSIQNHIMVECHWVELTLHGGVVQHCF